MPATIRMELWAVLAVILAVAAGHPSAYVWAGLVAILALAYRVHRRPQARIVAEPEPATPLLPDMVDQLPLAPLALDPMAVKVAQQKAERARHAAAGIGGDGIRFELVLQLQAALSDGARLERQLLPFGTVTEADVKAWIGRVQALLENHPAEREFFGRARLYAMSDSIARDDPHAQARNELRHYSTQLATLLRPVSVS